LECIKKNAFANSNCGLWQILYVSLLNRNSFTMKSLFWFTLIFNSVFVVDFTAAQSTSHPENQIAVQYASDQSSKTTVLESEEPILPPEISFRKNNYFPFLSNTSWLYLQKTLEGFYNLYLENHRDTVVQGLPCRILRETNISLSGGFTNPFDPPGFKGDEYIFFEDTSAHKVFVYNSNIQKFFVLYDFNLNVGDTLAQDNLVVTRIVDTTFLGTSRKKISFRSTLDRDYVIEWIEGIGNITHPLVTDYPVSRFNKMVCVKQNSSIVYESQPTLFTVDCNSVLSSTNEIPSKENNLGKLIIYPNPSSGEIQWFTSRISSTKSVQIFNAIGHRIYQSPDNFQANSLNISHWPPGVYYMVLTASLGSISQKFIKN